MGESEGGWQGVGVAVAGEWVGGGKVGWIGCSFNLGVD